MASEIHKTVIYKMEIADRYDITMYRRFSNMETCDIGILL